MSIKDLSNWITSIKHELTKEDFVKLRNLNNIADEDIKSLVNLWITEGIPFIFKDKPYLYEKIRHKIASGLSLHSKEISLIGSARAGFSYHNKELTDFKIESSDLDLFIVSQFYFNSIKNEIEEELKSDIEKNNQIKKGFLNTWHFDNKYPNIKKVNATITNINNWLHEQNDMPKIHGRNKEGEIPKWSGIRIYKDWNSAVQQNIISIKHSLENLKSKILNH